MKTYQDDKWCKKITLMILKTVKELLIKLEK